MDTFEIDVRPGAAGRWPVVTTFSPPGVLLPLLAKGVLVLSAEDIEELTSLLGQAHEYGVHLGRALFRDEVRDAFTRALAKSEDRLRVLLSIEADDPELKVLHWERLCAPIDDWASLAIHQRTPFSLYIPSLTDRRFPPIGPLDLRALVLVASPKEAGRYGLAPFDAEGTVAGLREALTNARIACDVLARGDGALGAPTLDRLCARLTDRNQRYTLLHIVCHGKLIEGGETVLYWETEDGGVQPVTATELIGRLRHVEGPRGLPHFAFLSTCESASPIAEEALGGLAQRLVRDLGMPAVVAMTAQITIKTARALAEAFYRQLGLSGEVDTALPEAAAALVRRGDISVPALFSRLGGRPLFSDQPGRELTNAEIRCGLEVLDGLLDERAPVLRERCEQIAETLRLTLGAEAAELSKDLRKRRAEALDEIETLCDEVLDLGFNALARGRQPPAYNSMCPFRGLSAFQLEHAPFFFGREEMVEQLRRKFVDGNFLAVLGPSGSGKSSLILAGLLPALQQRHPTLQWAYMTPTSDPLPQLEASLAKLSDQGSLLVIDQFEELFTLCSDDGQRRAFIDRMSGLVQQHKVLVAMRADFWGDCASYRPLRELMEPRQTLVPPMSAEELSEATLRQATQVGLRFEAGLASRIIDDVRDEPGAMPLLQHALLELWNRRHGRWLRGDEYEQTGGVREAIARTADGFYESLPGGEREEVRSIFVRLTRLDPEAGPGEKGRHTRRRVRLQDLVPADGDADRARDLVKRLADARLATTSVSELDGHVDVEVAHEALIRHWPRLRGWLDEQRVDIQLRDEISEAAREWERNGRDVSYLAHRGGRLAYAESLVTLPRPTVRLNQLELAYVRACSDLRRKEQRRRRLLVRAAWATAAVLLILAGAAGWQLLEAEQQRIRTIAALNASSEQLFEADKDFDALLASLTAAKQVKQALFGVDDETKARTKAALLAAVLWVKERNRLIGHEDTLVSMKFSGDGRTLASADVNGTIKLWDVESGRHIRTFPGARRGGLEIGFNADGQTLVAVSLDGTFTLWNVSSGRKVAAFERSWAKLNQIELSPDSQLLALGGDDGIVRLWNVVSGEQVSSFRGGVARARSPMAVAFSPDGKILASSSLAGPITLRSVDTLGRAGFATITVNEGLPSKEFDKHFKFSIHRLLFRPDGQVLLSWSISHTTKEFVLQLWDVATGHHLATIPAAKLNQFTGTSFSPDGLTLATTEVGVSDEPVKLWDATTGRYIASLSGAGKYANSVLFSPDGRFLASASDRTIHILDLGRRKDVAMLAGAGPSVQSVVFSPDGHMLATVEMHFVSFETWSFKIKLWNASSQHEMATLPHEANDFVMALDFSADARHLVSAGKSIKIWDIATGKEINTIAEKESFRSVDLSPDGSLLATASFYIQYYREEEYRDIKLWNVNSRSQVASLVGHKGKVNEVAFSPDGQYLASSSHDGTIKFWDPATGRNTATLEGHTGEALGISFSPDGKMLASSGGDGTVRLWDNASGKEMATLAGHKNLTRKVSFNRDGRRLASSSLDGTIKIWDATTKRELATLRGHEDKPLAVAFGLDGQYLASSGESTGVTLWNLDVLLQLTFDDLFARGCHWVRGYLQTNPDVAERSLCGGDDAPRNSANMPSAPAAAPDAAPR